MAMTSQIPLTLHADQEHSRLRTVVLVLVIVGLFIGYWLMRLIFNLTNYADDSIYLLSCVGSLPISLAVSWFAEMALKKAWPSGNQIVLEENGVKLRLNTGEAQNIYWAESLLQTNWHFRLAGYARGGRERRVARNWHCVCIQLRQEEQRVIVFTYLPPRKAKELGDSNHEFRQLNPRDAYGNPVRGRLTPTVRPEIPAKVITGKDGEFWLAERRRWQEGIELTTKDFDLFLQHLSQNSGS